jgi:single stranded DNA-binding protein
MADPCGRYASMLNRLRLPLGRHLNAALEVPTMNNQVTLVGHVGQAPTSYGFADGKQVVKFSIAVREYSPNSDEDKTLWFDVDAWNGLGDRVLKTITKGREVVLIGRLSLSTYTKEVNGATIQVTKPVIKLSSYHLCGRKPEVKPEAESDKPTGKRKKLAA